MSLLAMGRKGVTSLNLGGSVLWYEREDNRPSSSIFGLYHTPIALIDTGNATLKGHEK